MTGCHKEHFRRPLADEIYKCLNQVNAVLLLQSSSEAFLSSRRKPET